MWFRNIFCLLVFFCSLCHSQENVAIKELLTEAENKLYNQPEQCGKIAEYVVKQNVKPAVTTKATLLLAKSFYFRGFYDQAVSNALNAKTLANSSADPQLKAEATAFCIVLLRQLGLTTVAEEYILQLSTWSGEIENSRKKNWVSGKLIQDRAMAEWEKDNLNPATTLALQAEDYFSQAADSVALGQNLLMLADIFVAKKELDSALIFLRDPVLSKNAFFRLAVLSHKGRIFFDKKEFHTALEYHSRALAAADSFPNREYKNYSLQGLAQTHLALENSKPYFSYKQQANRLSAEIESDKTAAINSVYNFINNQEKETQQQQKQQAFFTIYLLMGLLLIVLAVGLVLNYLYTSKTKEYQAIYKYIAPSTPVTMPVQPESISQKSSIVPEETEKILLQKLKTFEEGEKFTGTEMSIAYLASQFDTNTKYLSEVINRHKGKNFNSYINELRIEYIINKLRTESVYFNYKISYLAQECGFSSHSSFATVFKAVTGVSPTKFLELLQKQEKAL